MRECAQVFGGGGMTITAILFDKDGTLLDFQASWGGWAVDVVQALSRGDHDRLTQLAQVLGLDLAARTVLPGSVVIAGTARDIGETIASVPGMGPADALTERVVALSLEVTPVPLVPLAPVLQSLKARGLALGVATNDAIAPTLLQLEVLGVADLFDFVAGYDSGYGAKPGPGPCLAFAKAMGRAPAECAMVGDSLHDLHAGGQAGMFRVAVTSGLASASELGPQADLVVPDITHLNAWLEGRQDER